MIRTLERLAVSGLSAGIVLLALDAVAHRGARFLWMIPHRAWLHHRWEFAGALLRVRPALATGLLVLCVALLLALVATLFGMRAALARRAASSARVSA